jgi:uncharacterized protein
MERMTPKFEWDDANTSHIARHNVVPTEAEQAVTDFERAAMVAYDTEAEERFAFVGATDTGRLLYVVLTARGDRARVVTARDAHRSERRRYGRETR